MFILASLFQNLINRYFQAEARRALLFQEVSNLEALAFWRVLVDSLPQEVAVVDRRGFVVAANAQWLRSAAPLCEGMERIGFGENLIDALRARAAGDAGDARQMLAGLEAALAGEKEEFRLDYALDEGRQGQWFVLEARRMPLDPPALLICRRDVTAERRDYASALQESERRERRRSAELQAIFDAAPIGLSLAQNASGDHIRGNPALERMMGVPSGGELSKAAAQSGPFRVYRGGVELSVSELPMQRAVRGEAVGGDIYDIRRGDGRVVTVMATAMPLYDELGAPSGAVGAFMDITQIRRAEAALRESEQRFRSLVEAYAQSVWETDAAGVAVGDSPSWRADTGQTLEEWLGAGWLTAVHPEDRARAERDWREVVSKRRNYDGEFRLRNAAGGWRWANVRATPIIDENGEVRKWTGMTIDIDARKQAEAALRASEERYRESEARLERALEAANAGVWELTPATGAFEASARAMALHGLPPDLPMDEAHALAAIYAEDRPLVEAALERTLATGEPFKVELRASQPDGSLRWLSTTAELRGEGDTRRLVGLVQDIDDRKRQEDALRENKFRLYLALDSGNIGIYEWRLGSGELICDDRMRLQWGMAPGEHPTYAAFLNGLHPNDRARVQAEVDRSLDPETGGRFQAEYRILTLDQQIEKWILATGTVFFEAGRAVRMVGTTQDVSQRKRAEIERQKFVSLAEQSVEFIGICDLSLAPIYVNPAGVRIAGLKSVEEAMGLSVRDFFFPEDHAFVFDEFFPRVLQEGNGSVEIRLRRFDTGEAVWMLYNVFFLCDADGAPNGLATVSLDITSRKRAEEALKAADRRKDEFLATLAHELRNPLSPICNASHVLLAASNLSERHQKLVGMIARQAGHLSRLVDDLMEVSRITRGKIELKMQRVDLADVLRHAIETIQLTIQRAGHELRVDLPATPMALEGDPVRLAQVFTNLLDNAAKYTEGGGVISLTAAPVGDQALVTVSDSGVGIPAEMLPHVFDLFTQVDRSLGRAQGGLGIGLSLVKNLLELHGGTVEARSDGLGRGSAFVVRLPLVRNGAQAPMSQTAQSSKSPAHRVLVIDDDHDVADSLVMFLETFGVDVRVSYGGESGLEILQAFKPELVFLDLGMPKMDGYETARRLRALPEGQAVKLVALTGWGQDQISERARDAGFDSQLTKPASFEDLQKMLESLS